MLFSAWYSLLVGLLMIAQWLFFLVSDQILELQTEPIRIAFHLAGEAITAISLIIAGVSLLRKKPWGRDVGLLANGLLVYTVIVSPGYFAQAGEWPLVIMFGVLLILAVASSYKLARLQRQ